jgi:hypothetical protein
MLMPHRQNAGQNRNVKIGNRSFENVAKFKYLEMTIRSENVVAKEIKSRLNYCNVQNF